MPHMPVPIRFIPSKPGTRKSTYREPGSVTCAFPAVNASPRPAACCKAASTAKRAARLSGWVGSYQYDGRLAGRDDEDDPPSGEGLSRVFLAQDVHLEVGLFRKRGETRVGERAFHDSDRQSLGRAAAEGEPENGGENNGEHENPEHRFRFASEFPYASQRQLDQRPPNSVGRSGLSHPVVSVR